MTDLEQVIDTIKRNVPSQSVTMGKPLEPWPHAVSFHRTLALHIHTATRLAYHSRFDKIYGIAETEEDAMRFDMPALGAEKAANAKENGR